jgi:hypothetical protein
MIYLYIFLIIFFACCAFSSVAKIFKTNKVLGSSFSIFLCFIAIWFFYKQIIDENNYTLNDCVPISKSRLDNDFYINCESEKTLRVNSDTYFHYSIPVVEPSDDAKDMSNDDKNIRFLFICFLFEIAVVFLLFIYKKMYYSYIHR